jgi:Uma2 family endonuclease
MAISEKTYRQVALEDPTGRWELSCGHLRSKPAMTNAHLYVTELLIDALSAQMDWLQHWVAKDAPRLRTSTGSYYVPDVCIFPRALLEHAFRAGPRRFQVFDEPMPFVAEVWSPNTGDYDVETKIAEYQRRGDLEIWRLHPYEKTVRRWIRRPDGSYTESLLSSGIIQLAALPSVSIEIESLFGQDTDDEPRDQ